MGAPSGIGGLAAASGAVGMGPAGLAGRVVSSLTGASPAAGVVEVAVRSGNAAVPVVNVQTGMGGRKALGARPWHRPA